MVRMSEELTAKQRVTKRERYSKWIYGAVGAGCAGFFVATAAWMLTDEPPVLYAGLAVYWLGCLGMGVGYWRSPVSLADEFERHLEREANRVTTLFVVVVTIVGVPADIVLSSTGVYTAPAVVRGAVWGYLLLVFVFVAAHWYVKRRYE